MFTCSKDRVVNAMLCPEAGPRCKILLLLVSYTVGWTAGERYLLYRGIFRNCSCFFLALSFVQCCYRTDKEKMVDYLSVI